MKNILTMIYGTLTFVPLILHWNMNNEYSLILPLGVSLVLLAKNLIKKDYGVMAITLSGYFIIVNILYFKFGVDIVLQKKMVISYVVLSIMAFISIKLYKPFTMDGAKGAYEKGFGQSPLFIEVNILISKIWGVTFLISGIALLSENFIVGIINNVCMFIAILLSTAIPKLLPEN